MPKLVWDQPGKRTYETGVSNGVLYPQTPSGTYPVGYAWNGLTGVTESPSGAEETKLYANNSKYLSLRSAEELGGTIEAYTYPDPWGACDGSTQIVTGVHIGQQSRTGFGLAYKTLIGNDTKNEDYGYKLHLLYGASVSPSERAYATINDSPEAITFSWEYTTTPIEVGTIGGVTYKPTSLITVNSTEMTTEAQKAALTQLEAMLFGSDSDVYYLALDVTVDNFDDKKESLYTKSGTTYEAVSAESYSSSTPYYYKTNTAFLPAPAVVYDVFNVGA